MVVRTWEVWNQGKKDGREAEFVNPSDPDLDDLIYRENRKMVPPEMRDYIRQKFGDRGLMARRDMVNNAVGYRAASVGDAWTGTSRWDEKTRQAFVDTATAVLGRNAFPWLTRAEKFWRAGVSAAKHTIVIRSVIVPASRQGVADAREKVEAWSIRSDLTVPLATSLQSRSPTPTAPASDRQKSGKLRLPASHRRASACVVAGLRLRRVLRTGCNTLNGVRSPDALPGRHRG